MSNHVEAILAKRPRPEGGWTSPTSALASMSAYADELQALVRRLTGALEHVHELAAGHAHADAPFEPDWNEVETVARAALASPEVDQPTSHTLYEPCVIDSRGKCRRWSHLHLDESAASHETPEETP